MKRGVQCNHLNRDGTPEMSAFATLSQEMHDLRTFSHFSDLIILMNCQKGEPSKYKMGNPCNGPAAVKS